MATPTARNIEAYTRNDLTLIWSFTDKETGNEIDINTTYDAIRFIVYARNEDDTLYEATLVDGFSVSGNTISCVVSDEENKKLFGGVKWFKLNVTIGTTSKTFQSGRYLVYDKDRGSQQDTGFNLIVDNTTKVVSIETSGLYAEAVQAKVDAEGFRDETEQLKTDTQNIATQAETDITTAKNSAVNEIDSAQSDGVDAVNSAKNSALSAIQTEVTKAETAATNAATSEGNASDSADSASGFATTATQQAGIATDKANEASASATNAATSEGNASDSADSASGFATTATQQAGIATDKANEASASATTAGQAANVKDRDRSHFLPLHAKIGWQDGNGKFWHITATDLVRFIQDAMSYPTAPVWVIWDGGADPTMTIEPITT